MGTYYGENEYSCYASWWIRSPHYYFGNYTRFIQYYGGAGNLDYNCLTNLGVVPALRVSLSE